VLVAAVALGAVACGDQSRISVVVDGTTERLAAGSTLATAVERLGLRPRAGNLVDVQGAVLRRRAYPGRLLLNGRRTDDSTKLRTGDRIVLVAGHDRRERLVRQVRVVRGGIPPNPQGFVSRTTGVKIVVRGAVSHKLVSTRYRTVDGPTKVARAVALTFDDGPSPVYTPRVLGVLRRMHVHATFFVIGFLVDAYPQLVRRERRLGMGIGNHTYNHPEVPPFNTLPRRLVDAEIGLGAQSLSRVGIFPTLLRPPAGSASDSVVRAAEGYGERVVLWSVDPVDWGKGVTAAQVRRRVLDAVRPGSIVDLHDGGGDRSATVAALPGIIRGIRHRHLKLVRLAP